MVALRGRGSVRLQAAGIARQRREIRWRALHKYTKAHKYTEAECTNTLDKVYQSLFDGFLNIEENASLLKNQM